MATPTRTVTAIPGMATVTAAAARGMATATWLNRFLSTWMSTLGSLDRAWTWARTSPPSELATRRALGGDRAWDVLSNDPGRPPLQERASCLDDLRGRLVLLCA